MKLNLEKDLIVFDVETTGLSVIKDFIIQIGIVKIFADGRPNIERCRLIKPPISIPKEASDVHGITNEDVVNEPTFKEIASGLIELIGDADFLTFNGNRFDIPMLMEEFERVDKPLNMVDRRTLDALRVFHYMEQRNLKSACKFYLNEDLKDAHNALVDAKATLRVFEAQIEKYKGVSTDDKHGVKIEEPIKNDMQAIHDFVVDKDEVDFQGKIKINSEKIAVFTFGKLQGKPVGESLFYDKKYMHWILEGDFATDTKKHIKRLVEEFEVELAQEKS